MLPPAVSDHYRAQQRLIVSALGLTRREWQGMGADFDASWARIGPRVTLLTASAQLGAARAGAGYVPTALEQQGITAAPDGEVNVNALAGVASDGRPLESLLYGAVTEAKTRVGQGALTSQALAAGGKTLDMYVQTMIADAARGAAGLAIAARPRVGWVRMVNPPSCSRCVVLAGKWFRWNQGFQRHPRCDCRHIPASEDTAGDLTTNPLEAIRAGQVTGLSKADTRAVLDGADVGQVINARRGMSVAQAGRRVKVTSEGVTRNGVAGSRLRQGQARLMPESIYAQATNREDAVRLLRQYGYII